MTDHLLFGLFAAGGFGREVMPFAVASCRRDLSLKHIEVCFVELQPRSDEINGYRVLSEEAFFAERFSERYFNVALADASSRRRIAEKCISRGLRPLSLREDSSVVYDQNKIGEGSILCAHTTITSNARIGRFFHANIYSYVAHDCIIGDFVTFAPGVKCNGNVHIGDGAYIGTGAILRDGTPDRPLIIGAGAVVGMGAVVTKNVAAGETVIGNPARPIVRLS